MSDFAWLLSLRLFIVIRYSFGMGPALIFTQYAVAFLFLTIA